MMVLLAVLLVNLSGFDFSRVWLAKHGSSHWKSVGANVKNGTGLVLTTSADWFSYDLRVQYSPKNYEIWENFDRAVGQITVKVLPDKRWDAHYE